MKIRRKVNMSKVNENWIGWNYKSRPDEIIDLVLDEVNDMLKKNKLKINYQYNDDNEEGWDYFLELTKENR